MPSNPLTGWNSTGSNSLPVKTWQAVLTAAYITPPVTPKNPNLWIAATIFYLYFLNSIVYILKI